MGQLSVPYSLIRGGSSKGLYFLEQDLPSDPGARNQLLLAAIGRDSRQIDGLGGGDPLTSKVAIISPSTRPGVDIDYLFAQIVVGKNRVDTKPNCGNILSGVGPFAIERGLVQPSSPETHLIVHMVNSGKNCELIMQTPNGQITYTGHTKIDGVPGTSATILCNYQDLAGSACGALLPTGKIIDEIDGIPVTCVDNGMPVALIAAQSLGVSGYESPDQLNSMPELKQRLHSLRRVLGHKMNLGDVADMAVPKMCLVSRPKHGGTINTRTFIPDHCHTSIGVLGAVSVASACILNGSVCDELKDLNQLSSHVTLSIEHPAGEFSVALETEAHDNSTKITKAGVIRTARMLSKGELYVPENYLADASRCDE